MNKLLSIIYGLLMLVQSWKVKQEQVDAQKQADTISKDPVDWFNGHFNGSLQQPAEAKTSKATTISTGSK